MKGFLIPLLFAGLCAAVFSCKNPVQEERSLLMPADSLIPEALMVQILADVHLLEAGLIIRRNQGERTSGFPDVYYQGLFRKYGISDARFASNLTYYQWDPEGYSALYDKVIAELKARSKWIPVREPADSAGKE
jgi:hypothetical protein